MAIEHLAAFRSAGLSSKEIGQQKTLRALRWIYAWGWSSSSVVDLVASNGTQQRGTAAKLVKRGLLASHPSPSAGGIKGAPAAVLTLTDDGVAEIEAFLSDVLPYEASIAWHQLRHDALVQAWTAKRLVQYAISDYLTPRQLNAKRVSGVKVPDAVWIIQEQRIAVELELTAKKERELHMAVEAMLVSMHPDKQQYTDYVILSHSNAILNKYKALLQVGAKFKGYRKDNNRHYKAVKEFAFPEWASGKFIYRKINL